MSDQYEGQGGSYYLVNGKRVRAEDYRPEEATPETPKESLVKPKSEDKSK